jgi:hypothetical protein
MKEIWMTNNHLRALLRMRKAFTLGATDSAGNTNILPAGGEIRRYYTKYRETRAVLLLWNTQYDAAVGTRDDLIERVDPAGQIALGKAQQPVPEHSIAKKRYAPPVPTRLLVEHAREYQLRPELSSARAIVPVGPTLVRKVRR